MTVEQVRQAMETILEASYVHIEDNSWQHAGHVGATGADGTHLAVTVVSKQFEGCSFLDRHRLVHQALKAILGNGLHALELKTIAQSEWEAEQRQRHQAAQ
ncbi:MAG: BolA family protein [Candidatus Melainabacteria bacterium]|nr:BolA family protein [Candidatus Melainabacteria bacterium]